MKYELTFLLNEESELKNIKDLINEFSGKILKDDSWGEKRLAFPIKKATSAKFYNWTVEMDQSKISDFKRKLNFSEKLMRYLFLRLD